MVLGAISLAVAGDYYFAFNLSMTTTTLLVGNMGSVLMPALCKLQDDPKRQTTAALNAFSAISLLALPVSFMQAAASGPILRLIWHDKWLTAVPILEVLSIGMAFQVLGVPGNCLLTAQGRFRQQFLANLGSMFLFFLLVVPGSLWKPGLGTGAGVAAYISISQLAFLYIAIRPSGGTLWSIVKSGTPSLFAAAVATGLAAAVAARLGNSPDSPRANLLQLAIIAGVTLAVYYPLVRWLAPGPLRLLTSRAAALLPARWRRDRTLLS
jgi:PST family polysaccharide transporter